MPKTDIKVCRVNDRKGQSTSAKAIKIPAGSFFFGSILSNSNNLFYRAKNVIVSLDDPQFYVVISPHSPVSVVNYRAVEKAIVDAHVREYDVKEEL